MLFFTQRRHKETDPKRLNYESSITNQHTVGTFVTQKCRFSTETLPNPTSLPEPDREKICVSVRFIFELKCWQCAEREKMHSEYCKPRSFSYMIKSAAELWTYFAAFNSQQMKSENNATITWVFLFDVILCYGCERLKVEIHFDNLRVSTVASL